MISAHYNGGLNYSIYSWYCLAEVHRHKSSATEPCMPSAKSTTSASNFWDALHGHSSISWPFSLFFYLSYIIASRDLQWELVLLETATLEQASTLPHISRQTPSSWKTSTKTWPARSAARGSTITNAARWCCAPISIMPASNALIGWSKTSAPSAGYSSRELKWPRIAYCSRWLSKKTFYRDSLNR